jgi:hypothetical protein
MGLPPFLRFLAPILGREDSLRGGEAILRPRGHVRVEKWRDGQLLEVVYDGKNFVLGQGLSATRDALIGPSGGGFVGSFYRMAIGDGGCPAGQLFSPKQPDSTWPGRTGLYHEVLRQDISVFTRPTANTMRFVGSFNSVDVDPTSYSLPNRVINEAALIIGNGILTVGGRKQQINRVSPDVPGSDERVTSVRTFKSTSFDPVDNVVLTVTWTLSVVR